MFYITMLSTAKIIKCQWQTKEH